MMRTNPRVEPVIGKQEVAMKELILRQRMFTDAIVMYGLTMSVVAALCAIALYIHL